MDDVVPGSSHDSVAVHIGQPVGTNGGQDVEVDSVLVDEVQEGAHTGEVDCMDDDIHVCRRVEEHGSLAGHVMGIVGTAGMFQSVPHLQASHHMPTAPTSVRAMLSQCS